MDFIDVTYSFLILLSLPGLWLLKKEWKIYLINIVAVGNITLLFYSVFVSRQLYALYSLVKQFNTAGNYSLHSSFGWFELRLTMIIILPFLFLFKKLSANGWLTFLIFILLNWSRCQQFLSPGADFLSSWRVYYSSGDLAFKILNYLSLLVGGYALLWLLKRLPHQQVN
jgi:hypothetical protein